MTLYERIARAREALAGAGVPADEAAGDAEVLARHALGWDLAQLVARWRDAPPPEFEERYAPLLQRRMRREPVSHIVGHREFWGLEFEVTPDVLTPRPETELIVEAAVAAYRDRPPSGIIDMGTGSGCLAVALATEFPTASVTATDLSEPALDVARRNALRAHVAERIAFVNADLVPPGATAELVVSNPPYISTADAASLPPEVREHEPHLALFAGPGGMHVYERLLPACASAVTAGGRLILEVGYDQHAAVSALARAHGFELERSLRDLQGIIRTLVLKRPEPSALSPEP